METVEKLFCASGRFLVLSKEEDSGGGLVVVLVSGEPIVAVFDRGTEIVIRGSAAWQRTTAAGWTRWGPGRAPPRARRGRQAAGQTQGAEGSRSKAVLKTRVIDGWL